MKADFSGPWLVISTILVAASCRPTVEPSPSTISSPDRPAASSLVVSGESMRRIRGEPGQFHSFTERFTIRNVGSRTVELRPEVQTTCGCTSAELSDTTVPPGGTTSLTLIMQSPSGGGVQHVRAVVVPVSPAEVAPVAVELELFVPLTWNVYPSRWEITGTAGERVEQTFVVRREEGAQMESITAETDLPGAELSIRKAEAPGEWSIYLSVALPNTAESILGNVTIKTENDPLPAQHVPVRLRVNAPFAFEPKLVLMHVDSSAQRHVVVHSDRSFRIADISSDVDAVEVDFDSLAVGQRHGFVLRAKAVALRQKMTRFKITARLMDENGQEIHMDLPVVVVKKS